MTPESNFGPAKLAGGSVVTPLARRLAGERGIDLSRVSGSGPHGRIVARDVEGAAPATPAAVTGASAAQVKALYADTPYEEMPLDGMRATIAKRLVEAEQTIPHFYLTADLDIGRLMAMREEANGSAPKGKDGEATFKLSLNDFIIKFWAAALQRIPAANAVWAGDRILRFKHSDIGVAVALDGGLITPVIRSADAKTLSAISVEMRDLAERARTKKLKPNEYQGGSSAISNLGMYGVREFAAIINPPHATILAIGAARRGPVEAADRRRQIRQPADGNIVLRSPRGRRGTRRAIACHIQEFHRNAGHRTRRTEKETWLAKSRTYCWLDRTSPSWLAALSPR